MNEVYIIEPLRTPVGKYGGVLAAVRPDDMAAHIIRSVVERTAVLPDAIDDVIFGCANQAGEDNRNIARMAALLAGLPYSVPGVTVNRLCASSLEAIIQAARAIRCGDAEMIIAGGVESMSRAPYSLPKNSSGAALFGNITAYDTALGWRYPNPTMEKMFPLESMGETAENIAERWNIKREEQDEFALHSHQKAVAAQKFHAEEIAPLKIIGRKGEETIIAADEQPRADTSLDKLSKLRPAFRKGGSVTAGNSSSLNDGAAALLLASGAAVERYGLKPLARFVSSGVSGVDPRIMGVGPVEASRKAMNRAGLTIDDIDLIELNEAFAAQSLACIRELNLDFARVNINGGAIALGHPLGMSGARIAGSLVRSMRRKNARYGLATLCIGVGQGLAAVFESCCSGS
ncbi:thiolase family protein [Ignavibacteria bacterium]|nr:acetyl-CoA C-acyltransferase [Bacteroidota bacterium]MCZ2132985.1 acetyl-CoA C-acyltransferase [Bacteroidota bacterium]